MQAEKNPPTALIIGPVFLDIVMGPLASLPDPGEEKWVDECVFVPGGSANQGIALAKLGVNTQLRAYVGEDEAGKLTRKLLEASGVSTEALVPSKRQSVTTSMSLGSDRAMVTYGTDRAPRLDGNNAPSALMGNMQAIRDNTQIIEEWSKENQKPLVIADVGWDESGKWDLNELQDLNLVDYFVPNEDEALHYTDCTDIRDAARRLQQLVPVVIITQGPQGVYAYDGEHEIDLPGIDIEPIDPTGAGDTFGASLTWALLKGFSLRQAVSTAALAATVSVLSLGGSSSAPTLEELQTWARKHPNLPEYDLTALLAQ